MVRNWRPRASFALPWAEDPLVDIRLTRVCQDPPMAGALRVSLLGSPRPIQRGPVRSRAGHDSLRNELLILLLSLFLFAGGCAGTRVDRREAEAHLRRGMLLRDQGKYADAAKSFAFAVNSDPGFAQAHMELGFEHLAGYLRLKDAHADYKGLRGKSEDSPGELERALASLRKAVELDPKLEKARHLLVMVLREQGDIDAAIEVQRELAREFPDQAEYQNNLGDLLLVREMYGEAAECYRRAIARRPDYPTARGGLGIALWRGGALEAGIDELKAAVSSMPDRVAFRLELARALLAAGFPDQALAEAEAARSEDLQNGLVYHVLAEIHVEQSQLEDAREAARMALTHGCLLSPALIDKLDELAAAETREGVQR